MGFNKYKDALQEFYNYIHKCICGAEYTDLDDLSEKLGYDANVSLATTMALQDVLNEILEKHGIGVDFIEQ